MLIALHKNATTTPATRAAIRSATGSDYELARQFNVCRDTIRKSGLFSPENPPPFTTWTKPC